MQEAPPSRSHPKNGWGLHWFFFQTVCPCGLGAFPYGLVESTAADRAAADKRRGGTWGMRGRPLLCKKRLPRAPTRRTAGDCIVFSFGQYAPAGWARFPASRLSPRRLTEPPRTCGVGDVGECEGGRFFARSASLALPPEERLGIALVFLSDGMPLRVGCVSLRVG